MTDEKLLPKIATVSSKGQITIPIRYARKYGLKKGSKIAIEVKNGAMIFTPYRQIVEQLAGSLKPSVSKKRQGKEVRDL
ncbi:MAG: AbrB/MazE/SpoVT family DNA-binding domain-containing protein [Chloroflexi bacterium]|nr:AbrB/MazE/SpoVT family DNA-binding domain-containing protein [Chloroflexota bacterium]